jgi:penicillin G amidase
MRNVKASACALAAIVLAASCSSEGDAPSPTPSPPPHRDIEIIRDDLGIAHVYGDSDEDVFYGSGYSMAEDRLFEMEIFRRRSRGERASLFGAAYLSDDVAARTFGFRALGAADAARVKRERPAEYGLAAAWAAGVNARIAEIRSGAAPRPYGLGSGPGEIDLVPEDWTPDDTFGVGKLLAYGLSDTLSNKLLASALRGLAPDFSKAYPLLLPGWDAPQVGPMAEGNTPAGPQKTLLPPGTGVPPASGAAPPGPYRFFEEHFASNNWAVTAEHTDNGRPLLCGDPHQSLTSPPRFYPVHLSSTAAGGTLDVVGFSFVGTPVVELGHNARVAWTATTSFADVMDIWAVETNDDESEVTLWDGAHAIERTTEVFAVRDDAGALAEQKIDVLRVPGYGVFLPKQVLPVPIGLLTKADAIMVNWTGLQPTLEMSAYLAMGRAGDLAAWESAVDLIEVGAQNFVGADAKSIALRVHALVPDRGDPAGREMPWHLLEGEQAGPASAWSRGFLPDEKLPHLRDPARGYIGTANADPFGFTADGDVSNDPYYFGAFFSNGSRARRINDELERLVTSGNKLTVEQMKALQRDHHSLLADSVGPHLSTALAAALSDPALAAYKGRADLAALGAALVAWDRSMAPDRGEPLAFLGLTWFAAQRLFEKPMSNLLFDAVAERSPPYLMGALRNTLDDRFPAAPTFMPEGKSALLLAALDDAASWLAGRFGTSDPSAYRLDQVQAAVFAPLVPGGPLVVPPVPVGGGTDTLNVAASAFFKGGAPRELMSPQDMSLYRMIVSFADDGTPEAQLNFAMGVSGEPTSPSFLDQQARWAAVDYAPLPFRKADVEQRAASRRTLAPPPRP